MSARKFDVLISQDNFDSCLLSFLRATSTIHDNEEAKLIRAEPVKDGYRLYVITTTERQLELPMEVDNSFAAESRRLDPLAR